MATLPRQSDLDSLYERSSRIHIFAGGVKDGRPKTSSLIEIVAGSGKIPSFASASRITGQSVPPHRHHEHLAFVFYDTPKRVIAAFGLQFGSFTELKQQASLRWRERWTVDAMLADGEAVIEWLATQNVTWPADRRKEQESERQRRLVLRNSWVAAAPIELQDVAAKIADSAQGVSISSAVEELRNLLAVSSVDSTGQCRKLLRWFAGGSGKCSGYPVYEGLSGMLLREFSTSEILAAIDVDDQRTVDGALRLFVGSDFRDRRHELSTMDSSIRQALRATAIHTNDADKRGRAERVVGPLPEATAPPSR